MKYHCLLIYLFYFFITSSSVPSNLIPEPMMRQLDLPYLKRKVQQNHILTFNFEDLGYIAGIRVHQIINNQFQNDDNHSKQFKQWSNKNQYCTVMDPQITMQQKQNVTISNSIIQHYVDHPNKIIFLQTTNNFQIYQITNDKFKLIKKFNSIEQFQHKNGVFLKLIGRIFFTNGQSIYQFQNYISPQTAQLRFFRKLPKKQPQIIEQYKNIEKIMPISENELLILYSQQYLIYTYDPIFQFKLIKNKFNFQLIKPKLGYFVDVIVEKSTIYLLNKQTGILEIKNYQKDNPQNLVINQLPFQYGQHRKFKKFGQVFQVICSYHKKSFVAQLFLLTNSNNDKKQLRLNRFYDKVEGVNNVALFNRHLHIFGENQIHMYGPAINRNILLSQGEYPYIFSNHGLQSFIFLQANSVSRQTELVGVNSRSLSYLHLKTEQLSIECQTNSTIQLKLHLFTTCCKVDQCQQQMLQICQYNQLIDIHIVHQMTLGSSILITFGFILILSIFYIGVVSICYGKYKIMVEQTKNLNEKLKSKSQDNKFQQSIKIQPSDQKLSNNK